MTLQRIKGDIGEDLARQYLIQQGYEILERNYRYKRAEIDLIVSKNNTIVFVEVKTRKDSKYGQPEEAINETKIEMMHLAAEFYVEYAKWQGDIRFDVISIIRNTSKTEIEHFEDAF